MFMFNYPLTDNNIYKNDLLENIKFFKKNKKKYLFSHKKLRF